ncbi:MAG: HIT family protein [Propionibacteriaceae bacterium]
MSDIVCQIVAGELSASVVARTDEVIAFLDHRPLFPGHVLVSPVRHVDTLLHLPADLMQPLLTMAQRIAAVFGTKLGSQGSFVAMNNVVSQSVPHLHIHVVPRTKGDGLRGFFWPRQRYATGEQDAMADVLREALTADDPPKGLRRPVE